MKRRVPPRLLAAALAVAWLGLALLELRTGPGGLDGASTMRGVGAAFGFGDPLPAAAQVIVELRLWRALAAGLVGGALGLSGALLQGLFRNGLADPSVLGVTAGATLGAALAILAVGGYLPSVSVGPSAGLRPLLVPAAAFAGALATGALVLAIGSIGGRVSVPTLLLAGIAINTGIAGILGAIQSYAVLTDWEIQRALLSWTFGTLDDREAYHVGMVGGGLALSALAIPFVATELDLLAGGEDDARALGVDVRPLKILVLGAAALATACAVSAVGQIGFLGLIVPHLVRLLAGSSHRSVLWLSALGGGVFLLATDLAQRSVFEALRLQPGVTMSLIGGPFFLALLWKERRSTLSW